MNINRTFDIFLSTGATQMEAQHSDIGWRECGDGGAVCRSIDPTHMLHSPDSYKLNRFAYDEAPNHPSEKVFSWYVL